jgi:hypothetical protein
MRYVTIPKPGTVPTKEGPKPYTLADHNLNVVAGATEWRESADKIDMLESILDKFEAVNYEPGAVVELTDKEHEAYAPIASMKGQTLQGEAARAVAKLSRAVLAAPSKDPRDAS